MELMWRVLRLSNRSHIDTVHCFIKLMLKAHVVLQFKAFVISVRRVFRSGGYRTHIRIVSQMASSLRIPLDPIDTTMSANVRRFARA